MDLAELLPKVPQNPVGTLVLPLWEPVQSAPAKTVTVADIAREAEARRAVVMKTTLNCIIVRLCSLKLLNDRKNVEWVESYTIGWWTGGLNANLIKYRKRSWRKKVYRDRYLYVSIASCPRVLTIPLNGKVSSWDRDSELIISSTCGRCALRQGFVCAMYGDRFCGELNPPSIHPSKSAAL